MQQMPYMIKENIEAPSVSSKIYYFLFSGLFFFPFCLYTYLHCDLKSLYIAFWGCYIFLYSISVIAYCSHCTFRNSFPRTVVFCQNDVSFLTPSHTEDKFSLQDCFWYEGFVFNDYILGLWPSSSYRKRCIVLYFSCPTEAILRNKYWYWFHSRICGLSEDSRDRIIAHLQRHDVKKLNARNINEPYYLLAFFLLCICVTCFYAPLFIRLVPDVPFAALLLGFFFIS